MADDERSRLHQIVDALPAQELSLARRLLELLASGRSANGENGAQEDKIEFTEPEPTETSPEMAARLAQLTDEELLKLDDLLENDRDGARQFWRERFGEELEEAD